MKSHLDWQQDADCQAWIAKLEAAIHRETLRNKHHMSIKLMLRDAFDMRDYEVGRVSPSSFNTRIPSTSPNLGRFIRL